MEKNLISANKSKRLMKKISSVYMMAATVAVAMSSVAYASSPDETGEGVLKGIISALLTISKYVGLGIVAFGVYEIAMSFMQQQPEAKTKGITMAVVGAVLFGLKTMLVAAGLGGYVS